ncbi:MAG TPA: hypothetical protein VM032_09495 [Vicinamibacterales bacterium]|nr:hypothetical protein [Vicinamibacterales bacterium]
MRQVRHTVALLVMLLAGSRAQAQAPYTLASPVNHLATIFTDLYGPNGLKVDSLATLPGEQPHSAHFNSDFQFDFSQFTSALVNQFVSVPLPSPSAGFTYQFDPSLGVFQRTTRSFGPILADRADTIGARRVSVAFAFQRFTFDAIEGLDLDKVPAVFTHDNANLLGGREDVVTTMNAIDATVSQSTAFVTVGVTDRFDVSVAVPVVSNTLTVVSTATVRRIGTVNPLTHFFRQSDGEVGETRIFSARGSATGLGDIMVRLKQTVRKQTSSGIAVGLDVRIPTGDEMELLGSGTAGVQPFAIWSSTIQQFSPHLNVSYRWNGRSVLAGNPASGESADFPDQVGYAAGADVTAGPRVTLAFDLLGRYTINAERLSTGTFRALDNRSTFPNVAFTESSFNAMSGTVGMKAMLTEKLLFSANVLFSLDDHGVRDRVTPLVGLEYGF